ncbi:ABC transporter substrate-binding protein [Sulfitobacter donghicola]|uniref:ABC transporter substrate-binding protein n=1 Tax=Sulfitobacter donghicola DSW-25 = KCTC 12864 = JCM 14565 TaxID=1300350 RepID=A0A073ID92_9RHOB|nr:ABC transporter substrate-binding protein [Sulfitobacter donghicola]KEJ88333.1 ABC transporter substrate-binding protein [Sulfitobacter donghicola DSW-25 = KCTC 12864 = JCM 14565]KIN68931.1 Bacterial extracellular solute-binding protein, family 5 [Sulfitobacter donghicola DSW-25 = KCTC 12864 = JCM 14565]
MTFVTKAAQLAVAATLVLPMAITPVQAQTELTVAVKRDRYNVGDEKFNFTTRRPAAQIVETAVQPDENFLPSPLLFKNWDYADGKYTIDLLEGVRFSDGKMFNADSAIAALKLYDQGRSDFLQIDPESFEKLGDYRISFRSETGSALVIENMTHRATSLFGASEDRATNPVGTGPYKLDSYEPKQHITVTRNPDYWGEAPTVDRLTFRFIDDDNARMLALQNGEIDVIGEVTPQMMLSMPQDGSVVLHESRPIRYVALLANLNGAAPFDIIQDYKVREALAWAIDRETLASVLFDGRGKPAKGILPGWMFNLGEDHTDGFGYDPVKAGEMLEAAGWVMGQNGVREKDGRALSLRLVAAYPNVSTVKPMPEMLDQMFADIGVDIDLIEVDDSGVYGSTYLDTGEADLYMEFASNNNTDPTYLLYNLFTSTTAWGGYKFTAPGPHVDEMLLKARKAQNRDEIIDLVRQAHRAIVQTDLAAIPILMVPNFTLSRPGIEVPMSEYADWIDYGRVTFDK